MPIKYQNTGTNSAGRKAINDLRFQVTGTASSGRTDGSKVDHQTTGTTSVGRKNIWERALYFPRFVGVGAAYCYMSENGYDWTIVNPSWAGEHTNALLSVCYAPDKGILVAVGAPNLSFPTIIYSFNGVDWHPTTITGGFFSVCYAQNKGMFVAIGMGAIATSTDGINWSTTAYAQQPNKVLYNGTRFITHNGMNFMYSDNGLTWNNATGPTSYQPVYTLVPSTSDYKDAVAIATDASYSFYPAVRTTDGISWSSEYTFSGQYTFVDICATENLIVAIGYDNTNPDNLVFLSTGLSSPALWYPYLSTVDVTASERPKRLYYSKETATLYAITADGRVVTWYNPTSMGDITSGGTLSNATQDALAITSVAIIESA